MNVSVIDATSVALIRESHSVLVKYWTAIRIFKDLARFSVKLFQLRFQTIIYESNRSNVCLRHYQEITLDDLSKRRYYNKVFGLTEYSVTYLLSN